MEEECEWNIMTKLTVGTIYSVASPLANIVSETKSTASDSCVMLMSYVVTYDVR